MVVVGSKNFPLVPLAHLSLISHFQNYGASVECGQKSYKLVIEYCLQMSVKPLMMMTMMMMMMVTVSVADAGST